MSARAATALPGRGYVPDTPEEIARMLRVLGLSSVDELVSALIPEADRLHRPLDLPPGRSEPEVLRWFEELADRNRVPGRGVASFLGAGAYRHHVPAVIHHLASRGEFLTAYTPYQPELSQGTLQAMYEYQTMTAELFGLDVANASNYDGASALAEAVLMAARVARGRRRRVILAGAFLPDYRETVRTYATAGAVELDFLAPGPDGRVDAEALDGRLGPDVAAVAVQTPNLYGLVEDLAPLAERAHGAGALLVAAVPDPHALALFPSPGEQGADIAVGEGQPLGLPLSFGGPYLGMFTAREAFVRQMPGRLVGRTVDAEGRPGFVLTLSTREQHIRRARATSNICSNQGLCALMVSIYLALLGPEGLREVARQSHAKALYLKRRLAALPGFSTPHGGPFFHEFVLRTPVPATELAERLAAEGIMAGVPLERLEPGHEHELLLCATEANTRAELDALVDRLAREAR